MGEMLVTSDGSPFWGSGGSGADATLYRAASGLLFTDDHWFPTPRPARMGAAFWRKPWRGYA